MDVQAAEKVFQTYQLTVRNPGGHSSLPEKDNAIYRLAAALSRVGAYEFPFETNGVNRAYFSRSAALNGGALAAEMRAVSAGDTPDSAAAARLAARSPFYNAQLRTTCVATMLEGGHARNALPQRASALVNCRIMPGVDVASIERRLRAVIGDSAVVLTRPDTATPSPPSVLPAAVESVIGAVTASVWGVLPIVPDMETGATDGLFLRNAGVPVYGVSGYFADPNKPDDNRAHGLNERISVKGYYDQIEFTYRLLKAL
jgi:acetylornithine deacetylase/succinyl-diaminopimelate desuccinylase-like protein